MERKANQSERQRCRDWSLWWSKGLNIDPPRDNIFLRSTGTEARAKLKHNATGYIGDMVAGNPIGQPLINACTFKFKKGFVDLSLLSCIDSKEKTPRLIAFLKQLESEARENGNNPVLVFQRNYHDPVICITTKLHQFITEWYEINTAKITFLYPGLDEGYVMMRLTDFFHSVDPHFFIHYTKESVSRLLRMSRC